MSVFQIEAYGDSFALSLEARDGYPFEDRPATVSDIVQRLNGMVDLEAMQKLKDGLANVIKIRDEVLPGAPIVMGEGTTCCTSEKLLFEEHSDKFWALLEEQALLLRENGLWGTVVRTGSSPVDISWNMRADSFRKANELFLNGKKG